MKIVKITHKNTKAGDGYKSLELSDGRFLNVFKFHSMFSEIEEGGEIPDASIVKDGKFWKLEDPKKEEKQTRGAAFKGQQIEKAQENKARYIAEAQDRKEESIAFFNATNCALKLLEVHGMNEHAERLTPEQIQSYIKKWRGWFFAEWMGRDTHDSPPFND
jgi:hypothetical protein